MENDKRTILVIDDDPSILLGLSATIRRHGYQVVTATNGTEGLEKAREVVPDLILSDVMMPPPDGFEMRRRLSADPVLGSIPFIFLTARSGVEDRVSGIRDGADDYIVKPFVTEELMARIEAVFRRVQHEQERGREEMRRIAVQDMEKLRNEILQNYHHELRTPLANIVMPLELAAGNKFSDPEEQGRFLHGALSNVDRLESLISDLILLSNLDHGNLNTIRQHIDIDNHILARVRKRLERYASKRLEFVPVISSGGTITAPRQEITQALIHLLDNAFKFSPEGGRVEFHIQPGLNGGATFLVKDNGIGIPPEFRERVFERYFQESSGDSREHEGMGVGLFIARSVFNALGGSVTLRDGRVGCVVQAILPDHSPDDVVYG
ncbi:MAG TPA: hybrid sensor histidine kinase/response regulator [Anaerolineales bacterium]|nr:hybrid sensor histidine kinase/response regulator [Anaerolineales bacterium]